MSTEANQARSTRSIVSDLFRPTGARLVWRNDNGPRFADICTVGADTIAWDGATNATTNALYHDYHDRYSYVEIRVTGRDERTHTGGVYGMKVRVRWTGADDSGEWHDAVMVSAATIARAA